MNELFDGPLEITRNEDTKEQYLKKSIQLIKQCKKELLIPHDEDLDVRQFVIWLIEHKEKINFRSWRAYKSAVVYFLETQTEEASIEALAYLKQVNCEGALRETNRTSSQKLKKFTLEDWEKLDNYFQEKQAKWHDALRAWLRSSLITGLRPVEWKNTIFIVHDDKPALKVMNAKNTNGRGNGEYRTLILENLTLEDLKDIKKHLSNIRTYSGMGSYEFFYNGCKDALYKACRACWPKRKKHITLYSTRHQFSANAKKSGLKTNEVAALMGHAVDITATTHYGKKVSGNEEIKIKPLDSEVSTVRIVTDFGKSGILEKTDNRQKS